MMHQGVVNLGATEVYPEELVSPLPVCPIPNDIVFLIRGQIVYKERISEIS